MHSLMIRVGDKSSVLQGNSIDDLGEQSVALLKEWGVDNLETYIQSLVKQGSSLGVQVGNDFKLELLPNLDLPE